MRRRDVIAFFGAAATKPAGLWSLEVRAQQPALPVIGFLAVAPVTRRTDAFRKGLNDLGYAEGRNVAIEFRDTDQYDRLPILAAELIRRNAAVIVTSGNLNAAQAAKSATATTPIVFLMGSDPVRTGLVASLNRPGGNLTGVTFLGSELGPKRLELLRELIPQATKIAFLVNPTALTSDLYTRDMQTAARSVGQEIVVLRASNEREIETAFATIGEIRPGGLLINNDGFFVGRRDQIVALATRHRVPTVYFSPEFIATGGLMSYSDDRVDSYREAGRYAGRILKGEKPADLPVLQPVKFDFVINLKTAKALGIEFPPSFHLRATEVIE